MDVVTLTDLLDLPVQIAISDAAKRSFRPNSRFTLPIIITTQGRRALTWSRDHPLALSYRWYDENGECIDSDGLRTSIPATSLAPRVPLEVELVGTSPVDEGAYSLEVSLVLEGVHWACDVNATGWLRLAVEVAPAPPWPVDLEESSGGRALRGALAAAEIAQMIHGRGFGVGTRPLQPSDDSTERQSEEGVADPHEAQPSNDLAAAGEPRQEIDEILALASRQQRRIAELLSLVSRQNRQIRALEEQLRVSRQEDGQSVEESRQEWRQLHTLLEAGLAKLRRADEERLRSIADLRDSLADQGDVLSRLQTQMSSVSSIAPLLGTYVQAGLTGISRLEGQVQAGVATLRTKDEERLRAITGLRAGLADQSRVLSRLQTQISSVSSIAPLLEVNVQAGLAGISRLEDELKEVIARVDRVSEVAELGRDETRKSQSLIDESAAALQSLQNSLERGLETVQSDLLRELRQGVVVVELVARLRELVSLHRGAGDEGLLSQINEGLDRLQKLSRGLIERYVEQRHASDQRHVETLSKLDSLVLRQTTPVTGASMVLVRNRFGLLAIQDNDARAIAYYSSGGLPERGSVAIVQRLLKSGRCFVDVGANVGFYSVIAGRQVGPGGKVVAFEPTPSSMRALQTTLAVNGLSQIVETHECALGSSDATATLYCEATSGHNSLVAPAERTQETHVISVRRGEAMLSRVKPSLIKVDVEGWELDVLEGLGSVIRGAKSLSLIVECSPEHIRRRGMKTAEWFKCVRDLGFKMWIIDDDTIGLHPLRVADQISADTVNLFLSRRLPASVKSMVHGQ